jgi:hemoglobin
LIVLPRRRAVSCAEPPIHSNSPYLSPPDTVDAMTRRSAMRGFNFPYLKDADGAGARSYQVACTPHAVVSYSDLAIAYSGRIDDSRPGAAVRSRDLEAVLTDIAAGRPRRGCCSAKRQTHKEDKVMAEPTLYERLGGIFAIAAVVDNFSDRLLKNPTIVQANPELHQWHTVTYPGRLPGLKWLRTLWLASLAGGPFQYTGRELRDAHFDLKIPPEVFDEVAAELAHTLDDFNVPEREKGEVLAGFAGEKGEVTAGSQPGAVNWRRWR